MREIIAVILVIVCMKTASLAGGAYWYDRNSTVIGFVQTYVIKNDESLHEVALNYNHGYNEIVDANPSLDPWLPGNGTVVTIPSMWILPESIYKGLIVNIAEMRLYQYIIDVKGYSLVKTYPIGTGVKGYETPLGQYRIVEKAKDPSWYVPPSIKKERPELPDIIGPGEENPLGTHALRLSNPLLLIHGTNRPLSIGRTSSRGCIRLYNQDIAELFRSVELNTMVKIVYQPIKVGERDGRVYIESHRDYLKKIHDPFETANILLKKNKLYNAVDMELVKKILEEQKGIPVDVTNRHPR